MAATASCSRASGRSLPPIQRRLTASSTRRIAGSASAVPNTALASPDLASPSTDASVSARRRAASRPTTDATPNRLVPSVAASSRVWVRVACWLSSASASAEAPRSIRTALRSELECLLVSSDSRSARNRSTTRPLRSSSSRDSPTIRPASEVARVPTSARSEVSACCRSAAIWAWACSLTRCASTCACSLASAMMPLPCSRASSRIRAASLRASASWLLKSLSAWVALSLASWASANSCRIASWRAVIALLIGGTTYFARMPKMIANAISSTMNVPLGTRKLFVSSAAVTTSTCAMWLPFARTGLDQRAFVTCQGRRRTAP